MHEKLVSHKLSSFGEKHDFLSAAQFAHKKDLSSTDALLTKCHLEKSLDVGMESYIVQLDFSAAFDRVSNNGLLFTLKSIGVGGSVLSICREYRSNPKQRVVVDGATSEWTPIVSGAPQGSVVDSCLLILYTREMYVLVENRL